MNYNTKFNIGQKVLVTVTTSISSICECCEHETYKYIDMEKEGIIDEIRICDVGVFYSVKVERLSYLIEENKIKAI